MALEVLGKSLMEGVVRMFGDRADKEVSRGIEQAAMRPVFERDAALISDAAKALKKTTVSSVVHFDENQAAVQKLIDELGMRQEGTQVGLQTSGTYMHLKGADGNWSDIPLQYLHDNRKGFVLRDVAPDTNLEYTVHAQLGQSHNQFYSLDRKADGELNTWGNNTFGKAEPNLQDAVRGLP